MWYKKPIIYFENNWNFKDTDKSDNNIHILKALNKNTM